MDNSDDFEISFIFTRDELYTLILLHGEPAEAGKRFIAEALAKAAPSDLLGLVDKKMAHEQNGKIAIEPVIRMLGAAICKADRIDHANDDIYIIYSPWITVKCERYPKIENCMKLTPVKPDAKIKL